MSANRGYYVTCDACGDPSEISVRSLSEARSWAKSDGWRRVVVGGRRRDICPRHEDAEPEELAAKVESWAV